MLPHEAEVQAEIATTYRVQSDAMTALHNAVVSIMTAGSWTISRPHGIPRFTTETMMGLLTKACKTFRAVQMLCERGLHDHANALVRVLLETTVAIVFILQTQSKQRMGIYHAHGLAHRIKMLNEWSQTPGLKRKASKLSLAQADAGLLVYLKRLPPGTNVRRHWSGTPSLQEAMKALRGDVAYATLYRLRSYVVRRPSRDSWPGTLSYDSE